MEIFEKEEGEISYLTINGRIDTGSSSKLEQAVERIIKENNSRLFLDLGNLEYLKSHELRVILNVLKKIKQRGTKVILCALNDNVMEIFKVCGVGTDIQIADSLESMINYGN